MERTLRICSLTSFQMYHSAALTVVIMFPPTLLLSLQYFCTLSTLFCGLMFQLTPRPDKDKRAFNLFVFVVFINLFIYFWLCWVSIAARGLSLVAASRSYSLLQCAGFSLQWLLLWSIGSRHVGFSSCGMWAPVAVAHRL